MRFPLNCSQRVHGEKLTEFENYYLAKKQLSQISGKQKSKNLL